MMEKVRELSEPDLSTVAGGEFVEGHPELRTPEETARLALQGSAAQRLRFV
jgi:hypothetical protein